MGKSEGRKQYMGAIEYNIDRRHWLNRNTLLCLSG